MRSDGVARRGLGASSSARMPWIKARPRSRCPSRRASRPRGLRLARDSGCPVVAQNWRSEPVSACARPRARARENLSAWGIRAVWAAICTGTRTGRGTGTGTDMRTSGQVAARKR
jgi:hypothetical protein